MTTTQSCAGSCHGLKIHLSESQRWLCQWRWVLCKPGDGNKLSLNLPASGLRPSNFSVYDALSPAAHAGTILHPRQGCCRSLVEPCNLLTSPCLRDFPGSDLPNSAATLLDCLSSRPLSLTHPGADRSSLPMRHAITRLWHLADFPVGWRVVGWSPIEYFSPDLCPTFLFRLLVSCLLLDPFCSPELVLSLPASPPWLLFPAPPLPP